MSDENDVPDILIDKVSEITCSECNSVLDVSDAEPFVEINCPVCSAPQVVPGKLGAFLLVKLLGSGGMGAVYQAIDESLGRNVAIKVMLKSMSQDAGSVDILRREARMAATLNHPNIVQIYSFGTVNDQPYIVMELVAGERLDEMIDAGKPLDLRLVVRLGLDIAQGLKAAYDAGLVHGDIKPENILLDKQGTAKVVDFGLAGFTSAHAGEDAIWGSPYYIAPEKVKKHPVDARTDMYSLGASLYHALTARPPFDGETAIEVVKARLGNPPEPITDKTHGLLANVNAVVLRMLNESPAKRHPTYESLIGDLRRLLKEASKSASGKIALKSGKFSGTTKRFKFAVLPVKATATVAADAAAQDASVPVETQKQAATAGDRPHPDKIANAERPPTTGPRMMFATMAILAMIVVLAVGTLGYVVVSRMRTANRERLVETVLEHCEAIEGSAWTIADTRNSKTKADKGKERYELAGQLRSVKLCGEAIQTAQSAAKKAAKLQELRKKAKAVKKEIKSSHKTSEVQAHLDAVKLLAQDAERLRGEIEALLEIIEAKLRQAAAAVTEP